MLLTSSIFIRHHSIEDFYSEPILAAVGIVVTMLYTRSIRGTWRWEPSMWGFYRIAFVFLTILFYCFAFLDELSEFLKNPIGLLIALSFLTLFFWWAVHVWQDAARKDRELREQAIQAGAVPVKIGRGPVAYRLVQQNARTPGTQNNRHFTGRGLGSVQHGNGLACGLPGEVLRCFFIQKEIHLNAAAAEAPARPVPYACSAFSVAPDRSIPFAAAPASTPRKIRPASFAWTDS